MLSRLWAFTAKAALLAALLLCAPAHAQNVICPTAPIGTSNNQCASTAFVQSAIPAVGIAVGSTAVTGGTPTRVLYDNAGVLGEYPITGSGSAVLGTSPTISAPAITGHPTVEGVTSTGATGTGNFVFGTSPSIASPTFTGTVAGANTIPLSILAQSGANTMLGNWTGSTANVLANTMPSCADSGGNHLNYVNGTGVTCGTGAPASSLVIASTPISGGTTTRIIYDNAGVLGEYTLTGSGTVAVMQTSPSLITPALGVATGTSLAVGGGSIGSDALEVNGTTTHNGATVVNAASFGLSGNISASTWTTNGVRYKNIAATLTDTTAATGTTATAYTDVWGGNTIAATNASVVYTNYFGSYFKVPAAGTNVTLTNSWALGADSIKIGTSNQFTVSIAGAVAANTVAIGGGTAATSSGSGGTLASLTAADQTLSGGANVTTGDLGTKSSGTLTIDCGTVPLQKVINGGAFTLAAPANDGSCIVQVTNNGSAGTITFSGFTVASGSTGAALTTTNTNKFFISIARINGSSVYNVIAQQ